MDGDHSRRSTLLLQRQLKDISKGSVTGFSAGLKDPDGENIYHWEISLIGPENTPYEGGIFKAEMIFPKEYPNKPPQMKFISDMWHPNVGKDGYVCISILHEPGDDKFGYEKASERWNPLHTVESILMSVISMLADPNPDSPANVDAAKELRENVAQFKCRVGEIVRKSLEIC